MDSSLKKRAIRVDPYSQDVEMVFLEYRSATTAKDTESESCAKLYNVSHRDWLLFSDLVHEKRKDVRLPGASNMNVQVILSMKKKRKKVIMYVRDDLPPRNTPERDIIPGFSLNFGINPNNFWGGMGYIDICSLEEQGGKEEEERKDDMLKVLLETIKNNVTWTKTKKSSYGISMVFSGATRTFLPSCGSCSTPLLMETKLRCGKCHSTYYCNKSCQINHWKIHRNLCESLKSGREQMMVQSDSRMKEK
jgi:hypothetical protein